MLKQVVVGIVSLVWSASVGAETITVCLDGSCDFADIQSALNSASDGDIIEVGPGVYYENITAYSFQGMTCSRFSLIATDGPELTVLDGQFQGPLLSCYWSTEHNVYSAEVFISGFTVRNGYGNPPSDRGAAFVFGGVYGGGATAYNITNCRFEDCMMPNAETYTGHALVFDSTYNSLHVSDCSFSGGDSPWLHSVPPYHTVRDCSFADNAGRVTVIGGKYERCTFFGNVVSERVAYWGEYVDCTFSGNLAGRSCLEDPQVVSGCSFIKNEGSLAGAINRVPEVIAACSFDRNTAPYGGAVRLDFYQQALVTGCDFGENVAGKLGGAIYVPSNGLVTIASSSGCGNIPSDFYGPVEDGGSNQFRAICCQEDFTFDGQVSGADLSVLLGYWGSNAAGLPAADLNSDGIVDGADLAILLSKWGLCDG